MVNFTSIVRAAAFVAASAALAPSLGCGSGAPASGTSAPVSASSKSTGSISFHINWPKPGQAHPAQSRFIPSDTNSIVINALQNNVPVIQPVIVSANSSGISGGTTTVTIPVGSTVIQVAAYALSNGAGNAIATGNQTVTIAAGPNNPVTISLQTTIASVTLTTTSQDSLWVTETRQFTAEAVDSSGNMVLSPGYLWSATPTPPALVNIVPASNSSMAAVTGMAAGTGTISVSELDTKTPVSIPVTVAAAATSNGTWFGYFASYLNYASTTATGPTSVAQSWSTAYQGGGTQPVFSTDLVYTSGYTIYGPQALYATDPHDGHTVWTVPSVAGQATGGSDGTVYVSNGNLLNAISPNSVNHVLGGNWPFKGNGNLGPPMFGPDHNIYVQDGLNLYCLSSAGAVVWQYGTSSNCAPAVLPGAGSQPPIAFVTNSMYVTAIQAGKQLWQIKPTDTITSTTLGNGPVTLVLTPSSPVSVSANGDVYVAANANGNAQIPGYGYINGGKLLQLNPASGAVNWQYPQDTTTLAQGYLFNGLGSPSGNGYCTSNIAVSLSGTPIAVGANDGSVNFVDPNGNELGIANTNGAAVKQIIMDSAGTAYFTDGTTVYAQSATGSRLFPYQVTNSPFNGMAIDSAGTLYVAAVTSDNASGTLTALTSGSRAARSRSSVNQGTAPAAGASTGRATKK